MYDYDVALIELFTGFDMDYNMNYNMNYNIGYTAIFSWTLITF